MAFLDAHHSITPLLHWLGLSDRRLRFWFFHNRRPDWFALFHKFDLAVRGESRPRWDQVTHDHILFESAQTIDLAERGRFSEHARRVLE